MVYIPYILCEADISHVLYVKQVISQKCYVKWMHPLPHHIHTDTHALTQTHTHITHTYITRTDTQIRASLA